MQQKKAACVRKHKRLFFHAFIICHYKESGNEITYLL